MRSKNGVVQHGLGHLRGSFLTTSASGRKDWEVDAEKGALLYEEKVSFLGGRTCWGGGGVRGARG